MSRRVRDGIGSPSRWMEWHARHGTAGRAAYSGFTSVHGPLRSSGVDELGDPALEVHRVAAQAVVHQLLARVVLGVHEQTRVRRAVRPALPVRVLLAVAGGAALDERKDVRVADVDLLRRLAARVQEDALQVLGVHAHVGRERAAVARGAAHAAVGGVRPRFDRRADLVAAPAARAVAAAVVRARSREDRDEPSATRPRRRAGA